MNSRSN